VVAKMDQFAAAAALSVPAKDSSLEFILYWGPKPEELYVTETEDVWRPTKQLAYLDRSCSIWDLGNRHSQSWTDTKSMLEKGGVLYSMEKFEVLVESQIGSKPRSLDVCMVGPDAAHAHLTIVATYILREYMNPRSMETALKLLEPKFSKWVRGLKTEKNHVVTGFMILMSKSDFRIKHMQTGVHSKINSMHTRKLQLPEISSTEPEGTAETWSEGIRWKFRRYESEGTGQPLTEPSISKTDNTTRLCFGVSR